MKKKTVYIFSITIFLIIVYIGYQMIKQKANNKNFMDECQSNPNINTTITIVVKKEQLISDDLSIKLNSKDTILEKTFSNSDGTNEYNFSRAFGKDDRVEIILRASTYVIDKFQFGSVIINNKKGPECKFIGAFVNGNQNNSDVFVLK